MDTDRKRDEERWEIKEQGVRQTGLKTEILVEREREEIIGPN